MSEPNELDQIKKEYSQLLAEYGDKTYRSAVMKEEAAALLPKMKELNQKAYSIMQVPKEEPVEDARPVEVEKIL